MGIFRTKVDKKADNSGWRMKIVSDKRGYPVEPFFLAAESGP